QGRLEEAITEYRAVLRLKPDFADAHDNLGAALSAQGNLEEAIAEYREALRLKPNDPAGHYNLGNALRDRGKREEAVGEYQEALRLHPHFPTAHCNLGLVLQREGRFAEALSELKCGHELGTKDPRWPYPSAQWVRQAQRLVELDQKLPSLLSGRAKPGDVAETCDLALVCSGKKLHGASARLWAEALRAQPKLAEDPKAGHRYHAACAATLAGSGQGKDDPPLDDATKTRWRKQAIDWLKADLRAWSQLRDTGPRQARPLIIKTLQSWKADPDLASLRDPAALAKLPREEQDACRALWTEVDTLLARFRTTEP
ncbi:MAG TPA: tetratricopeptide repeat protein, partial [Isosphaeraceae bacterium]|nr:tetratricopeptide repeat protein [Isosphaeraceae bacterium]